MELREKMRMLRVKMPVNGVVRTLYVDESKTVEQLMEGICPQLRITNHHNFSLAREPREVVRSVRSKAKARKERSGSAQSEETTGEVSSHWSFLISFEVHLPKKTLCPH